VGRSRDGNTRRRAVPFLGRETFLRNKRAAARPKDLADIDALKRGQRISSIPAGPPARRMAIKTVAMSDRMARAMRGWLLVVISCSGCLGRPINGSCAWPTNRPCGSILQTGSDQRHLNADARFAEELAIRYADVTRGKRSGHFTDFDEYHRTRERCPGRAVCRGRQPSRHHAGGGRRGRWPA